MIDGSCEACEDYTKGSSDGRTCESISCEIREYTTVGGKCEICADYLVGAGKECIAVTCGPQEKVEIDGSCNACKYSYLSLDGKACESDTCEIREYTTVE